MQKQTKQDTKQKSEKIISPKISSIHTNTKQQSKGLYFVKQNQSHMKYSNNNQKNPDPPVEVELCQKYISWQGSVPTNQRLNHLGKVTLCPQELLQSCPNPPTSPKAKLCCYTYWHRTGSGSSVQCESGGLQMNWGRKGGCMYTCTTPALYSPRKARFFSISWLC